MSQSTLRTIIDYDVDVFLFIIAYFHIVDVFLFVAEFYLQDSASVKVGWLTQGADNTQTGS